MENRMNPKVSIIVPIYNAEEKLRRCIESILKQDFTDFELLLMDDGSTDESGKICDEYAAHDSRIYVLHKENSGVSDTRNQAIRLARGKYLQFADSDDWLTPDATGLLVGTMEKQGCDLVISDFYRVVGERLAHKGDIQEDGLLTREEFASYMMENPADYYYGVLWNKLYKKSIIEANQLFMDKEVRWCEDFLFNMEYIRHVKSVYALQVPIYYYVKTKGSLVNQGASISRTIQMKRRVFKCYNEFFRDVFNQEDYEKNRLQVYQFLIDAAGDGIVPPSILPGSMKLGDERVSISLGATEGAGFLFEAYRERKLMERYLETVALKQDMSLEEVKVLFYLSGLEENGSLEEMADITVTKKSKLRLAIQKLINRDMIRIQDKRLAEGSMREIQSGDGKKVGGKKNTSGPVAMEILPGAEGVLTDILWAKRQFHQICYEGLSGEEIEQYEVLLERVKTNVQRVLK
ncbi:MAG: glycosyltransferase family 2 protein [Lachnospiraceae bacterium]